MRRSLLVVLVLGLLLVGAQSALAYGPDFLGGGQGNETCLVPAEYREKVAEILETFRTKMEELRERMASLRGSGNTESMREIHAQRLEMMEQKRQSIAEYIPEDAREEYLNRGLMHSRRAPRGKGSPWQ